MKVKRKIGLGVCLLLLVVVVSLNQRFEIIAFHPFYGSDCSECSDPSIRQAHGKLFSGQAGLKVMTWNVHCSNGTDSVRQQRIAELILQEDADFVLLNEIHLDSCLVLDSLLKERYAYSEEAHGHQKCGDVVYSKREMSNSGETSLRKWWKKYIAHDGEAYPDSLNGRSIQAIKATFAIGRDSVQILGCHWPSNSGDGSAIVDDMDSLKRIDAFYERYKDRQQQRVFQAKWTKELILESPHPVIVMGDMNDFNCSAPLDTLTSCGLKDAWWEGGTGYGCTFHTGWMRLRIDHILYGSLNSSEQLGKVMNGLELTGVKVISTDLSDHNPIVACFRLVWNGNE